MDNLFELIPEDWQNREKADEKFWENVDSLPAFASSVCDPGKLSSDMTGLQEIIYDPDTPYDTAIRYKDEGNCLYNKKNFILASDNYTKAIKMELDDKELNCILYTNRAACHFHRGNFRKSINDCQSAIKFNPLHTKAYWRAAVSASKVDKFDEVLKFCKMGLEVVPESKELITLQTEYTEKQQQEAKEKLKIVSKPLMAIESNLRNRGVVIDPKFGTVEIPQQHTFQPLMDIDNNLHLNVLLLYPEYNQTDFLQDVVESATITDCVSSVFSALEKSVDWDEHGNYVLFTPSMKPALQAYYENSDNEMVFVNLNTPLQSLLLCKGFRLRWDLVVEINIVSILSTKFFLNWKKTVQADLD